MDLVTVAILYEADDKIRGATPGFHPLRGHRHDSLTLIAKQTNGRVMVDSNNYQRILDDIERDLSSYYQLAFTPGRHSAGTRHEVRHLLPRSKDRERDQYDENE